MYYMIFDIFCPYLVQFGQYFINCSPPTAYERIPLGINRTLSYGKSWEFVLLKSVPNLRNLM